MPQASHYREALASEHFAFPTYSRNEDAKVLEISTHSESSSANTLINHVLGEVEAGQGNCSAI